MLFVWISLILLFGILLGYLYRRWYLSQSEQEPMSLVSQQHLDLFNGGGLDEHELELTRNRYQQWLQEEQFQRIEATLVPGLSYVVRVRALAELGTEEACAILERQLSRIIIDDPLEQAWYWIDIAHSLRMLAHDESLPLLLDRVNHSDDFPLVHFYASELIAFSTFPSYLTDFHDAHGKAAIRVLHRALEGLRCGISAHVLAEARMGEMIETVWDKHQQEMHPLLVRLFCEVQRLLRRFHQYAEELEGDVFEKEAYEWQMSRLALLEDQLIDYASRAREQLPGMLHEFAENERADWIYAIHELRADAGASLVHLIKSQPALAVSEQAVLALGWSRTEEATTYLQGMVSQALAVPRHPRIRKHLESPSLVAAALIALRYHPGMKTEQLLMLGVRSGDSLIRSSALSSMGWWMPMTGDSVLMYLQDARYDHHGEVRHAARAALARLGERQALQWFRQGLASENRQVVVESIQAIADEGITLLWPELDMLVDEEEPELASCAREALEQMQEELERDAQ
ncbi:MAG: hypothetical protein JNJ77_17210 [Planctomycetia bacterium]|nr:hypothetical protein [Planctomycetia bacterium]